jgi:hypothetical protein
VKFRSAVLLCFVSAAHCVFAQTINPTTSEGDQPELVARLLGLCRAGMGDIGVSALAAVRAEGSIVSYDGTESAITWEISGNQSRFELQRTRGQVVAVVGKNPYTARDGERKKLRFAEAAHYRPEFLPAISCSSSLQPSDRVVRYVEVEQVDARALAHLHLWREPDSKHKAADALLSDQHLFIDTASGEVVRLRNFSFSPESLSNRSVWEVRFSDFRIVDGLKVPFRLDRYLDGQWHSTIKLTSVDFHATNSPSDFE